MSRLCPPCGGACAGSAAVGRASVPDMAGGPVTRNKSRCGGLGTLLLLVRTPISTLSSQVSGGEG
eukprot:2881088-Prymnesium_polylepis.1